MNTPLTSIVADHSISRVSSIFNVSAIERSVSWSSESAKASVIISLTELILEVSTPLDFCVWRALCKSHSIDVTLAVAYSASE